MGKSQLWSLRRCWCSLQIYTNSCSRYIIFVFTFNAPCEQSLCLNRRGPNFCTSQSCFLSSYWFSSASIRFVIKPMVIIEPTVQRKINVKPMTHGSTSCNICSSTNVEPCCTDVLNGIELISIFLQHRSTTFNVLTFNMT